MARVRSSAGAQTVAGINFSRSGVLSGNVKPTEYDSRCPVSQAMTRAAIPLIEAGVQVPSTYVADGPGDHGKRGSGRLLLPAEANLVSYSLLDASEQIVVPEPCPAWSAEVPPEEAAWDARDLISAWIMRYFGVPDMAWSDQANLWLRTASEAEQTRQIVSLFDQLRRCALDDITLPWER